MKKITLLLFLSTFLINSCQKHQKEFQELDTEFSTDLTNIVEAGQYINSDSLKNVFKEKKEIGLDTAKAYVIRFKSYTQRLIKYRDSVNNAIRLEKFEIIKDEIDKKEEYRSVMENSKAGKLQKKHPDWNIDDCQKVLDKEIWVGMNIDMVKYMRGLPDSVNPSDYGSGVQYQWCWHDHSPSCFYGGADGIVSAYN